MSCISKYTGIPKTYWNWLQNRGMNVILCTNTLKIYIKSKIKKRFLFRNSSCVETPWGTRPARATPNTMCNPSKGRARRHGQGDANDQEAKMYAPRGCRQPCVFQQVLCVCMSSVCLVSLIYCCLSLRASETCQRARRKLSIWRAIPDCVSDCVFLPAHDI